MWNNENGSLLITKSVTEKEDAIRAKMKIVEPKFLGIKMINYERDGIQKVWIPNAFLVYDFEVNRNVFVKNSRAFIKSGQVAVVFDLNELHTSLYNLIGDGQIPMIKKDIEQLSGIVLPDNCSWDEMLHQAEYSIQRQILRKAYRMEGKLKLVRTIKFYREAWELRMFFKGREFIKYAYPDQYGTNNERARGLKTRLGD